MASLDSGRVRALRHREAPVNAHCALCGGLFGVTMPWQRFCSKRCRAKVQRIAEERRGERAVERSMLDVPPRRERYEDVCLACSRATPTVLSLSDMEAYGYVKRGLRRCPRAFCGGVLQLVCVDGMAASR